MNHIDGNKKNNCVENLEWVTASENKIHAFKTGLQHAVRGSKNVLSKLNDEQVKFIRENYKKCDKIFGREALAKKFNVNVHTILRVVHYETYN